MRQESLSGSVKTIFINRDELLGRLSAIAKRIHRAHPEVVSVRVFGSIARGDQTGTSDADVMIVLRGARPIDPLAQIRLFQSYFDLPIGVDVLVFPEGEVTRRIQAGDGFMTQIWNESVPLENVQTFERSSG